MEQVKMMLCNTFLTVSIYWATDMRYNIKKRGAAMQ